MIIIPIMMNKKFEKLSVSERKHLYYHFVGYWHGVLKKFQPDAIIFPVVPHTVYDFIVYSLAKLLGIKTIFFMLTRIGDRIMVLDDFVSGSRFLKEQAEQDGKQISPDDLAPDIREYYLNKVVSPAVLNLPDVKFQQDQYSFKNLLIIKAGILKESLKSGNFGDKIFTNGLPN